MKKTASADQARNMTTMVQGTYGEEINLEKFRQTLHDELAEALNRHELLNKIILRYNTHPKRPVTFIMTENDTEIFTLEELTRVAQKYSQRITLLKQSLERIGDEPGGSCKITGKLIAKEALKKVPVTTAGYGERDRACRLN